jgi:hypothetical protein
MFRWIGSALGYSAGSLQTRAICDRVIEIQIPASDHSAFASASAWLNERHKGTKIFVAVQFCFEQISVAFQHIGQYMLWTLMPSVPAEIFDHQVQVIEHAFYFE